MSAVWTQLAIAVVDAINAVAITPAISGAPAITAERSYVPVFELEDVAGARITVIPGRQRAERVTRRSQSVEYTVDVAVHRRAKDDAERDAMVRVAEQVFDVLGAADLDIAGVRSGPPVAVEIDPVFSPELLLEKNVFLSVIRATWPAVRETS